MCNISVKQIKAVFTVIHHCYVPHCVKGPLTCFLYFLALSLSFAVPLPLPYNRSFLDVYAKQTVLGRSSNWLVNGGRITAAEPHP
ncbi:hypothetical protein LDENG_00104120 [Lucifuga dentata]|nr:hypothetical protein LDENG_00104120 [Lucifuga dentata]